MELHTPVALSAWKETQLPYRWKAGLVAELFSGDPSSLFFHSLAVNFKAVPTKSYTLPLPNLHFITSILDFISSRLFSCSVWKVHDWFRVCVYRQETVLGTRTRMCKRQNYCTHKILILQLTRKM
jgi:hypothetical protein